MPKPAFGGSLIFLDFVHRLAEGEANMPENDKERPDLSEVGMQMAFFPGDEDLPNASEALVSMKGVKPEGIAAVSTIIYFECDDFAVQEGRIAKSRWYGT